MSADKHPEHHKRDLLLSDRISQSTVKDIIKDILKSILMMMRKKKYIKSGNEPLYGFLSIHTAEAYMTALHL